MQAAAASAQRRSLAVGPRKRQQQQHGSAGTSTAATAHASPTLPRRPRCRRRDRAPRIAAFLSSDGGASVGSLLTSAAVAVSVGAALVALYNDSAPLGGRRRRGQQGRGALLPQRQLLPASSDDNLRWAVMGVVSCLPLFNWMVRVV
jgi:hypothetical protein